jgi:hypothetical protein
VHPDPDRVTGDRDGVGLFLTEMVRVTTGVCGSIRVTVPANSFVTHTALGETATPEGPSPTWRVAVTTSREGSIRDTVPSRVLATHTAPGPAAMALGPGAYLDSGHITAVERDPEHDAGRLAGDPHRPRPDRNVRGARVQSYPPGHPAGPAVDADNRMVAGVRDPHRPLAVGDPGRSVAHRDRLHDAVGAWIDTSQVPSRVSATYTAP